MVYLDNNATTPLDPRVVEAMTRFLRDHFGNPSSLYPLGRECRDLLTDAREAVAGALGAHRSEIVFTASGTEADNFAVFGVLEAHPEKDEFITSAIEHPAILESAKFLERKGYKVTYLPVDETGVVSVEALRDALTGRTALVSVMHANNEIGTIQPVEEIVRVAHAQGVPVHTDAVQTFGKLDVDTRKLGVDLLSVSAHKVYGPKGVGALYIKKGTDVVPYIHGGHQEKGLRAGTENTAGIIGFAEAVRILGERAKKDKPRLEALGERLRRGIEERVPRVKFNGHPEKRVKTTVNFAFPGLEAEAILLALATKEIYVSTGSACSSESDEVSPVLTAIGLRPEIARSAVRFSIGRTTTDEDIDTVLTELPPIVEKFRQISAYDPNA
jgi:cysteine desulfurase